MDSVIGRFFVIIILPTRINVKKIMEHNSALNSVNGTEIVKLVTIGHKGMEKSEEIRVMIVPI